MQTGGRMYSVGSGIIVTVGLLIIFSVAFSLILRFSSVTEASLQWLLIVLAFLGFGIGGFSAGNRSQDKGLFTGSLTAIGVIIIILLCQYLGYDHTMSAIQGIFFVGFLIVSALGAAIGVNRG
ncbi:TIGR04086 family membrane protein [Alteribacillus iranensis]|uniref:Putative membrane protein, TIGR04086 family n=1 Tax=Alteribacillus iranensis TaxID=930128 RepID=A0A1I1Z6C5_9BACI|nr:TIGR04086 family membrane protein [Alteribacillus iranensis]SFE27227.1 putative membrane protein, TIGR04086 family [Alteribacillus iranensis]